MKTVTKITITPGIPIGDSIDRAGLVERLRSMEHALSVSDLAKLLGMGKNTLYTMVRAGKVPSYDLGNTIRIDPVDAADWLESRRRTA